QNARQLCTCQRTVSELQQRHELLVAQHAQLLSAIATVRTELEEAHQRLASLRALPFLFHLIKRRLIEQTEQYILEETAEQAGRYAALRMLEHDLRQSRRLLDDAQEQERAARELIPLPANAFTLEELELLVNLTHDKIRALQQCI